MNKFSVPLHQMRGNIQMAQKSRDQAQEGDPTSLITATLKGRQEQAIL